MVYTGILLRGDTYSAINADPPIAREAAIAGEFLAIGTLSGVVHYLNIAGLAQILKINAGGTAALATKTSDFPIEYDAGDLVVTANGLEVQGSLIDATVISNITKATALEMIIDSISINPTALNGITSATSTALTVDAQLLNPTVLSEITEATSTLLTVSGTVLHIDKLAKITEATSTLLTVSGTDLHIDKLATITDIDAEKLTTDKIYYMGAKPTITALSTTEITVDYYLGDKVEVYNFTTSTLLGELTTSGGTLTFTIAQTIGDVLYVWGIDADDNKTLQRKGIIA